MTTTLSLPDGFAPPADRKISQQPTGSPKRFWSSRLENIVSILVLSKPAFKVREGVPKEIEQQICDNIKWIRWSFFAAVFLFPGCCLSVSYHPVSYLFSEAGKHEMVVGSQARILYSDQRGRTALALRFPHLGQIYFECSASMPRFNAAIAAGDIEGTVVISRDHHDVSGTDSPFR